MKRRRLLGMLPKLIALLLVAVFLLTTLAACSGDGGPSDDSSGDDGSTAAPVVDDTPGEPDVNYAKDGVPTRFNLAVRQNRYHYLYCDDENTKDTVEYETWKRNSAIEEKYGIEIYKVELASSKSEWTNKLQTGSTGDIDLACWDFDWGLEQLGYFVDLCTLDELNLDQDWYYNSWNENVTINDVCYSTVGDAALETLENVEVVFFNKGMAAANELDLYGLVDDGEWTLAKAGEIARDVSQNLDDATRAIYGLTYDVHAVRSGLFTSGIKMVTINPENGAIGITAGTTKNVDIADALTTLVHGEGVQLLETTARATDITLFTGGKTMMLAGCLFRGYDIRSNRDEGFSYGVLVVPKYDSDSDYMSTFYGVSTFSIPTFCTDRSMSAVILDAMNRRSKDTIVNAFYNNVLMSKVADAPDDARMLGLARSSVVVDFAFVASGTIKLLPEFQVAVYKNSSISTTIAGIAQTAKTQLETLMGVYQ